MNKPLLLAALLSASAALVACDNNANEAEVSGASPTSEESTVIMPSPAPENTVNGATGSTGAAGSGMTGAASPDTPNDASNGPTGGSPNTGAFTSGSSAGAEQSGGSGAAPQ